METRVASGILLLTLLLLGTLKFSFNIQPVRAESLEPPATEWTRTYGGANPDTAYSVVEAGDGGYALAGYTTSYGVGTPTYANFWLVKTDAAGNVEWNRTYGGAYDDVAYSLVQTSDEGYALAGYTNSFGLGYQMYLVKIDSSGNMQWNQTYGGTNSDFGMSVVQTADEGYAVAGYTNSYGVHWYDFWLVKTDSTGFAQWNKTYRGRGFDYGMSMAPTADGGYAVAGYTGDSLLGYKDFWLVKTDSSGNAQWNRTYGGAGNEEAYSLVQTSDGGYALAGSTSIPTGRSNFWLVKTDSGGNHQWNRTFGGLDTEIARSLVRTSDGYAVAGYTESFGVGNSDFWLVKTDSSGNHQWNQTYGEADADVAYSLVGTSDGGYALAGSKYSPASLEDFWLVKVAPIRSTTYPWPMFHHNPRHTGYTESPAPETNKTLWNYTTGWEVSSSPAVADGMVYVGSADGKVYALDQHTGAHIWNYTTGVPMIWSSPAVADGIVFIGSGGYYKVYALNQYTGEHVWNYTTASWVYSSPAVVDGKVYVGSYDDNVYCLNASTGEHIWNYKTGAYVSSSPAVANDKVYVGSFDSKVYCLDALNGEHIWNYTTGGSIESSPAVADDRIYVGSDDYKVYCLDALTGEHIWNNTTGSGVYSSPAVADGSVYVGSQDGKVYCLDALTGTLIWNYTTGDRVFSSPAVADGKVYVGSFDGRVHCLDASTGTPVWNYTTGGAVGSSPAVADGVVFIGSNDNTVYAFGDVVRVPEDYPTVQEAIDAAEPGATVSIAPGTYYGASPVAVINKTLTLLGRTGSSTKFAGGGSGIAVNITDTSYVTITNIDITDWDQGIYIDNSSDCQIYNNVMYLMRDSAIVVDGENAANNQIYNNVFQDNNVAIDVSESSAGNIIYGNTITQNSIGINVVHSSGSTIYCNSFIDNVQQVNTSNPSSNTWDAGGLGNYWSNYTGIDANGDGIGDTPHPIYGSDQDNYPLMSPYEYWRNPMLGDVNRDTLVNYEDLFHLTTAYGATPAKPNWNANCDLHKDYKIAVRDLFNLSKNYGETAP